MIGAIDVETKGLDGPQIFWTAHHEIFNGSQEPVCFTNSGDLLEWLFLLDGSLLRRTRWYSHNAEYDWRYLINDLLRSGHKIEAHERAPGTLFKLTIKNSDEQHITAFYDSMAIYAGSLKNFAAQFAPDLPKDDIGLGDGVQFNPRNPDHVRYAQRDVVCLCASVDGFDNLVYRHYGVHLKGTIASTAYAAAEVFLKKGEGYGRLCAQPDEFIRNAYYGGMVRLNCGVSQHYNGVTVIDRNSSYPAAMKEGMPAGSVTRTTRFNPGVPGFYHVKVTVPDQTSFPILPYRTKNGIAFPWGNFETFASSLELEEAISQGCIIHEIEGWIFREIAHPFDDFVHEAEIVRSTLKGTPSEATVKIMQNALYGKFGTGKEGREILITEKTPLEKDWALVISSNGEFLGHVWERDAIRDAPYMLPHFAAWITAKARLALKAVIESVGENRVFYTDTDSVHALGDVEGDFIGKKYGEWKREKIFDVAAYHAPKAYTYEIDGKLGAIYKGIPKHDLLKPEVLSILHAGNRYKCEYHSSNSVETFLKTGKLFIDRIRTSTNPEFVTSHRIVDGQFKPLLLT